MRSVVTGILAIVWGGLLVVLSTYLQENHGRLKFASFPTLKSDMSLFCKQLKTIGVKSNRNEAFHNLPYTLLKLGRFGQ